MAQSVVLLSVTKAEQKKSELKTDSLGKTQRSESQKGEIAVSMRQLVMELIGGVEGGKSALHAKSHTKVRQGAGREKGSCVFSIDLSAFNCRQAANETRPADSRSGTLWYVPQRINLNISRHASTHSLALSLASSPCCLKL